MIDLLKTIKEYCESINLVYVEGLCDLGRLAIGKNTEVDIIKEGAYRASILSDSVEIAYGFSPIHNEDGVTLETQQGARRALLYNLINQSISTRAALVNESSI